jgi:hypothetical protein
MSHTAHVVDDFVIARNPEEGSKLPYLLRIPVGANGVVLKSREMWPRTAKAAVIEAFKSGGTGSGSSALGWSTAWSPQTRSRPR